ncbi:ATP-dependent helicase HepA [Maioricimonas rarisocia]|uniref:ATP-dependent helicase HepA n=1 Tax=Maioricimonas rarisocia TaxID=2528026 RepID=A0A517ZFJ4_9PLAN|nr:helicase-related protein [Maioricimonas rarisocia]QDU41263.1 ATP-dependent helicase HepA [Maioricimonas rarisocia]
MIERSQEFNLGRDKTRIKDRRDADRQEATVDELLSRFFHSDLDQRWEVQIVADEVGMGKTFVALATAYSVVRAMHGGHPCDDLRGCYNKIVIVTPNNSALFAKWQREVGEFVKRCVPEAHRTEAARLFAPARADKIDDLVAELRKRGKSRRIIVTTMGAFYGKRFRHYDIKRRLVLGCLFGYWGNRFNYAARDRLLHGAPDGWPISHRDLLDFTDEEQALLPFAESDVLNAVRKIDLYIDSNVEKLLTVCQDIATPYARRRGQDFRSNVIPRLDTIYTESLQYLLGSDLPMVIVDEAHNWKNGPSQGSNGYRGFMDLIGSRTRRALLLTATPFQLRPKEMLEILKIGESLQTSPQKMRSKERQERLRYHREEVIKPVLDGATTASRRFTRAWSKLPVSATTAALDVAWRSPSLVEARDQLNALAAEHGAACADRLREIVDRATGVLDPATRPLLQAALELFVHNSDLSHELGRLVIRHRRNTEHRLVRVGSEFQRGPDQVIDRPDRHVLHAAPGFDVRGEGELPHYLLMRCVSEMKGGKGKSSLGSALTGCYSTLNESSEGKAIRQRLTDGSNGRIYLDLLKQMVNEQSDERHPKVAHVVDAAVRNWRRGEKSLIFCFRTNTARRLHDIIGRRIQQDLDERKARCMGGANAFEKFASRLTRRTQNLVTLGLDRVLWSLMWNRRCDALANRRIEPADLELRDDEWPLVAQLALQYDVDLLGKEIDRVFLNRACEHVIARRLVAELKPRGLLKQILDSLRDCDWVSHPYGCGSHDEDEGAEGDAARFDERGVHHVYHFQGEPDRREIERVAGELRQRRQLQRDRHQQSVLDSYRQSPSLWLGDDASRTWETWSQNRQTVPGRTIAWMHEHLLELTLEHGETDWGSRLLVMQAIRRAVLRESVLVRLLPERSERDEADWGTLLVNAFFRPLPSQHESMADRIEVFLEDLKAASGSLADPQSARHALFDATRLKGQKFVALVAGSTDPHTRERVFSGFNTPLLPEVLVCTSVGQEGIDLHRHCRHVVHFDLAWNPAVLEQRTGRTDRIGSKTFRERHRGNGSVNSFLDIGVPFLAGTYDERMYEELRLRAQVFEVLTGGDLTADAPEGNDDQPHAEGTSCGVHFVPLPDAMVNDMRVTLHVWSDEPGNGPEEKFAEHFI